MNQLVQPPFPPAGASREQERRSRRRRRVLLRGTVIVNGSTLNCSIQNISEFGCKLKFAVTPLLPENFTLRFNKSGEKRKCQLVWLADREVGVRFADAETPAA